MPIPPVFTLIWKKTRIIWIGSKKGSEEQLCTETKLNWDQNIFTVLGIIFSINLQEMIDINYSKAYREIKNVLIQWSKRKLTPYGKITIIKSLAMAKMNHYIMSLPNPSYHFLKDLNRLFYNFVWNNKIDRVKRTVAIKPYKQGGLKMIDIFSFINALKITWIRRSIQKESKWLSLLYHMYPKLQKFHIFGIRYVKEELINIDNHFWKDVFHSWTYFTNSIRKTKWLDFINEPIWSNNSVKIGGKTLF